jgi:D-alanyl-lipoteichoic acid acyltransferase DltB (MBOAT superfamily)
MSFVDIRFVIFFPVVVVLHFLLPERFRWMWLLLASYIFYMAWRPEYALLLATITVVDFTAGIVMKRYDDARIRKTALIVSLVANLGILFFFKYFNFFFASIGAALAAVGTSTHLPVLDIILPIGISFHIFQSVSYTIDVYKRKAQPVTHLGKFALYVSFFPQLVAGPIERPNGLLVQFFEKRRFDSVRACEGAKLMLVGYFKKLVIADNVAPLVNAVYAHPHEYPGPSLIIATLLFAYQLYCDFSGYTDIARGSAKILGYDLAENFTQPYASATVAEFWRKWHISLSSWLRDYLYTPLALSGKRHSALHTYASLIITFVLIGLWHGANWTYVTMGALHGIYLVTGSITTRWPSRKVLSLPRPLKVVTVFLLVSFTWIFFRASSMTDALYITSHLFSRFGDFVTALHSTAQFHAYILMGTPIASFIIALLGIATLEITESYYRKGVDVAAVLARTHTARLVLYGCIATFILLFGTFYGAEQFIYFQF